MSILDTMQEIYEAFGRGDIPAILAHISDHARWEEWPSNSAVESGKIPYLKRRHGKEGAREFFESLSGYEIKNFAVHGFLEGANQVCVVVSIDNIVKTTGKRIQDEELHLWSFNNCGEVIALRHYVDTGKHIAAHTRHSAAKFLPRR